MKCKIIELLEITEEKTKMTWVWQGFLESTSKAQTMKEVFDKLNFIKIKTSVLQKTMLKAWEDKPQTGWKHLQNTYPIKDCYSKIYKQILKFNMKPTWFKNWPKVFTDTSPKEIRWWQISVWKMFHIKCHQGNAK